MKNLTVKSCIASLALSTTFLATAAYAESQHFKIEAPVVSASPMVKTVTEKIPHQTCWNEQVRVESRSGHRSRVPPVLGAVIGGVAGGAIGDNTGHQGVIATAGALLGAAIGHDQSHKRPSQARYVTEQRCATDYELRDREEVTGYRVGYEYGGNIYYTQTPQHPGSSIQVSVILKPANH
jgi:uncharacterized protein YcfJ